MCCILCLQTASATASHIEIFSTEGQLLEIEHTILKHFWLQPNAEASNTRSICHTCWQALSKFHQFYHQVEEAHRILETTVLTGAISALNYNGSFAPSAIKLEDEVVKVEADIHVSHEGAAIAKRRRGRPRRKKSTSIERDNDKQMCELQNVEIVNIKEEPTIDASDGFDSIDTDMLGGNSDAEPTTQMLAEIANSCAIALMPKKQKKLKKLKKKTNDRESSPSQKALVTQKNNEFIAENFKLSCCLCQVPLPDFNEVKTHFRIEHKTRGYVRCCGKKFLKRGILVDHIHTHFDPEYFKCKVCDRVMASRRCLELHMKNHDDKRERIYRCEVCSKSYYRQNVYTRHMMLHVPDEQKTVPCPQCNKTFGSKYIMNQHHKLVHLNMYAKICDICGKSIRGKEALRRHQEEHEGVQRPPIQCDLCGVTLTTKYGLARHMKVMHTEEFRQPQVCTICSKVSATISAHQRHMQYMHNMERKHACPMCEKAFKRAKDLREHMTTHTGEVLYTCPHCPKTFNSNANMYAHRKKIHHKEWEEKRRQRYNRIHKDELSTNDISDKTSSQNNINVK